MKKLTQENVQIKEKKNFIKVTTIGHVHGAKTKMNENIYPFIQNKKIENEKIAHAPHRPQEIVVYSLDKHNT